MSENQNRGIIDFANYDTMTTEELEEILRLDAEMPQGQESDTELLLYIMEVLAERKRNNGHTGKTALEAYESFKQSYMPETDNSVIPMKAQSTLPRWVRRLSAAAAVLVILIVGAVTANAFGFNIWQSVVQWTQETFNFGDWGNSDPNNSLQFTSLQEALEYGKITTPLAPTWLPDGYELTDVTIEITPLKKTYSAKYENGEQVLKITVRDYLDGDPYYVEQSEDLVEEYRVSGITYYLFDNNEQVQTAWIVDSYECCISGRVEIDVLKLMINSIGKG